jgi:ribosomal protein S1
LFLLLYFARQYDRELFSWDHFNTIKNMDDQTWYSIKAKYPVGAFVRGAVTSHKPFGVFLDIGEQGVTGLIRIVDFVDEGEMREDLFPAIGKVIGGIVYGYSDHQNAQINLDAKPSTLHDFLMALRQEDEIDPTYLQDM